MLRSLWHTIANPEPSDAFILPTVVQAASSVLRRGDSHVDAAVAACSLGPAPISIADALKKQLNNENDEVVVATIWAVSSLAASRSGLRLLLCDPSFESLLAEWLEYSSSSNGEMRSSLLSAVASVIDRREIDDSADAELLKKLFLSLFQAVPDSSTMERLMRQLEEPLVHLRFSVFAVFKALAKHAWGIKEIVSYPGVKELLTNRGSEHTKQGAEWKFAILQQLVAHPASKELLGVSFWHELLLFVKQGPFFFRHESKVAVEDTIE